MTSLFPNALKEIAKGLANAQAQLAELNKTIERLKRQLEGVKDQPRDKSA